MFSDVKTVQMLYILVVIIKDSLSHAHNVEFLEGLC